MVQVALEKECPAALPSVIPQVEQVLGVVQVAELNVWVCAVVVTAVVVSAVVVVIAVVVVTDVVTSAVSVVSVSLGKTLF